MKILFIAPTPFFSDRGTHIRILEEALALEKRGHQITLVTYHIGRDVKTEIKTNIDIRRILRLLFWYKKLEAGPDWQKIILDILLIRKTFYLARRQKPDIIHAHLHEGVLIGWIVKNLLFWRKIKLVADFHGSLVKEMVSHSYLRSGFLKKIFQSVENFINRLGDYAICSSPENTQVVSQARGGRKIDTVLDGAGTSYYANILSKKELRRELELPQEKIIVVYTGALAENKGVGYLLEAIECILQQDKRVYFLIGGFPAKHIEKFIREKNFTQSMRLVSPLNYFDLPKILAASDIAVDPKDSETRQASGKILQYMAAGLPVVCFDRLVNREYLKEGGEYAVEVNGKYLAKSILTLANNAQLRELKGKINKKRSLDFSWGVTADKIEKIYKKLLY